MEDILKTEDFAGEQAGIKKQGKNNVYFLPYLMGERSPHNDPSARGTFIGLTMDTTREDMTQAVLEGVTFGLRDSFEGAKSPLWRQMVADIFNLKVDIIESEEGPGYGAAILAAVGCGEYASVQEAADKLVKVVKTIEPDPETAALYEEKYQKFRQIYPAVKGLFPILEK